MAHMDTVYPHGALASHPFKVDGDHAYGLGIADDKQGVALILHALAIMKAMNFRDYARITVAITADEELSTPGSRTLLTKLGAEHDAVISCEASDISGSLELATAGIGSVVLRVKGRASHAGVAPEAGRNALYELAHQILQMRDLSDPSVGRSLNWTVASAGTTRNVIPEDAQALGDVRVLRAEDYDWLEQTIRRRTADRLIPDTQVEATIERRRPPLVPTASSRRLAERAQRIFMELGKNLPVKEVADGAGTDAAFAAARTDAAVIEDLGVAGEGYHANGGESIYLPSIEPRLYLLTRLIITAAARSTN
jgi:glutamate carboxypeptidase